MSITFTAQTRAKCFISEN